MVCFLFEIIYVNFHIIQLECQFEKNEHFRYLLSFVFNQGYITAKAARNICAVYGVDAKNERTACDG